MEKKTFSIPSISCGHCVNAIKTELNELDGVTTVEGDIEGKRVEVEWDAPATEDIIKDKLTEINYPAAQFYSIESRIGTQTNGPKAVYFEIDPGVHRRRQCH